MRVHTLETILVEEGSVSPEAIQEARLRAPSPKEALALLLREGRLTEEALARARAKRYGVPFVDLGSIFPDPAILKSIPTGLIRRGILPFHRSDGRLAVAMADPGDLPLLDEIRLLLSEEIDVVGALPSLIQEKAASASVAEAILQDISQDFQLTLVHDENEEALTLERVREDERPIIRLVNTILLNALDRRASDIHTEGTERHLEIKYRVDGMLYPAMDPLDRRFQETVVSRIKVMAELDIAERRVPQDGRFKLRLRGKTIDCRVSVLPSEFGEAVVIRILDKESIATELSELTLEGLGFPERDLKRFRRNVQRPHGMILVTGPTGSGKTTTLYAAISEITTGEDKTITIEDPIEYQLRHVVQIPVNEKKGLTFARGLRAILRHDPDKIMVGEIRDPETAQIAVQAALTGHLVFTTVHANNITDVIGRLTHMGLEPYNFVSALNCILTQRLVRLVCEHCRVESHPTPELLEESGISTPPPGTVFYVGKGCPECLHTGYRGRTGVFELVEITDRLRELILARRSAAEIRLATREEGTESLRQAAVSKVLAGMTTLAEANRVTFVEGP
ncbi:MAG: GspE/PulE family protein [Candidatus Methylomirabilales bacterium]